MIGAAAESIVGEEAVLFGPERGLVGILSTPQQHTEAAAAETGVILLNAGVVHRVGPHRLYVSLARRLAECGFKVLRFDHSGIGDSLPRTDGVSFEVASVAEAIDAMNYLSGECRCQRFVLIGLCSGTLTAFKAAEADARVAAIVLLTALLQDPSTVPPEVVAEATDRRIARSYVVEKAGRGTTWKRLITGKLNYHHAWRTVKRLVAARARPHRPDPGTAALVARLEKVLSRGVALLFVFAEPTTVLEYFRMTLEPSLPALRRHGEIAVTVVTRADHTFTQLRHQRQVVDQVAGWLSRCI